MGIFAENSICVMKNIKITKEDRFVFEVIGYEDARKRFGTEDIYRLYDDDTEGMIMSIEELEEAISDNMLIGVEMGFEKDLGDVGGYNVIV